MKDIRDLLAKRKLHCGRMISGSKTGPKGHTCVFNANIITSSQGKVWFGDLDLTREGEKLKEIAKEIGEPIYVLRERDCRFETENDPISTLITKSVWSTEQPIS